MEEKLSGVLIVILDTHAETSSAHMFKQLCTYLGAHDTGIALIAGVNEKVTQPYLHTSLLPVYNSGEFLDYTLLDSSIIQHFAHIFMINKGCVSYTHSRALDWSNISPTPEQTHYGTSCIA